MECTNVERMVVKYLLRPLCAQPKGLQFSWGGQAGEYGIGEIQWEVILS